MAKTVIAAALGECVHVAGITNFLRLAEIAGWTTIFLGPAVSIEQVLKVARGEHADLVGISYRLTPETGERLLGEFAEAADDLRTQGVRFAFGGTPLIAGRARQMGFFERVFEGGEPAEEVLAYLQGETQLEGQPLSNPQTAMERIQSRAPFPLLRHHFGLPSLADTLSGVAKIAEAQCLDVISLGIDQDAQENFFKPQQQDPRRKGAGGVPVRSPQDYSDLYAASRRGNYPLMRTYAGTDDFIRLAEMYQQTIHNAWCAVPLYWFNQMDGRGPWDLEGSLREHQRLMAWYGQRNLPVEINEPHHWGMRDAPDVIFVVSAFLAAYNARAFGVKDYIAQLMFNCPPRLSGVMDLAKMLAIIRLIQPLSSKFFRIWIETRSGLLGYPLEPAAARAHLAVTVYQQMALKPHILHVVGHTEAHHAATAEDVIEACLMARRAVENALNIMPDQTADPAVQARADELAAEARVTLQAIRNISGGNVADPYTDPHTLANAVRSGILDAPQLRSNAFAPGKITTLIVRGACQAVQPDGSPLSEAVRLAAFIYR